MIISFRHKGLEQFYRTGNKRGVQASHAKKLNFILAALDVATEPADMSLPAFSLRSLQGELKEMVFAPLSISATDAAERLSMCRPALSRVLIIQAAAV